MNWQKGFSLLELIIVMALIGILGAASAPAWEALSASAAEKAAARAIASALREARANAIGENREHEIRFNCAAGEFIQRKGNRATNSIHWAEVKKYKVAAVAIKRGLNCNSGDFSVQFNPNGTASSSYACIQDNQGRRKYAAGVSSSITGRVVIRRWNAKAVAWD